MKKFFGVVTGFTLVFALAVFLSTADASAQSAIEQGIQSAQGTGVPTQLFGDGGIVTTITNVLLFVAGALAVIMLIIGGLRYTLSGGNASSVTAAKNTILYAIVGLIIAFLAFAAVNWVLGIFTGAGSGYTNV